jgi:hypothetical protein
LRTRQYVRIIISQEKYLLYVYIMCIVYIIIFYYRLRLLTCAHFLLSVAQIWN